MCDRPLNYNILGIMNNIWQGAGLKSGPPLMTFIS